MKKWQLIITIVAIMSTIAAVTFGLMANAHRRSLTQQVKSQQAVIDRQGAVIDSLITQAKADGLIAKLWVTDRSRTHIRGNKGNIIIPQDKHYLLELDSIQIYQLKQN